MNIKFSKYIFIFLLGCIFTCILFIPSFNMDGICTLHYGYDLTSLNFLGAGRVLTYITYIFFAVIKLPINALSIISILFSNIFLSIAVIDVFEILDFKKNNLLCFVLSFLLIYNPITLELFLFDEAFIMCLGVLFGVKGVKILNTNIKQKYLVSLIYISLCTMCYQGVFCVFLPLAFLNIILRYDAKNTKDEIKNIIKEFSKTLIIYVFALLINFVILKVINILFISSKESGTLNIFDNLLQAFKLCIWSIKTFDGYVNIRIYYFIMLLFICLLLIVKFSMKVKIKYVYYLLITIILALCNPFIINLAMNPSENYTAARMYVSVGFVIPIISIYLCKFFNVLNKKIYKYIFYVLVAIYFTFVFNGYIFITKGGLESYKMDVEYMGNIKKQIEKYEIESGIKVKKIYWAYDINSNFCNEVGFCNSYSYRFFARDWSAESAIGVLNDSAIYIEMSNEDKIKYFEKNLNVDYTKYEEEQLIFDKENLYLLIY